MNNISDKKRKEKGYTLGELLTTVMILVILLAIAIPAIFTIRRNLRQKALDSKAEVIYTAVQNNLTKLRSNGNSSKFAKDKATKMDMVPMDATEKKTLYYVTANEKENTGSAASALVTTDTVDTELYDHYWVVEYDPASASVYAVFYSETRSDYTPAGYDDLRYKDERLRDGARVGYYGGDSVDTGNTSTLAPKITITNEEKLIASISCMRPDSKPLSFEVTLEDSQNHKLVLQYEPNDAGDGFAHGQDALHLAATSKLDANESGTIVGTQYNLDITLDDLTKVTGDDGKETQPGRFLNLYGSGNSTVLKDTRNQLVPGTGLTITVKVKSDSSRIDGLKTTVKTNSLFADGSTDQQAVILYGRHLQNLDKDTSGVTTVTSAVQQSDIHFEKQEEKEGTASWYSCYGDMSFTPIHNSGLNSFKGSYASSGGTVFSTIYHLTVVGEEKAGLFAELPNNITVDSVRLSGTKISASEGETVSSGSSAGALAGSVAGTAQIRNCQVFLESSDIEGKDDSEVWISGAAVVGGLIGHIEKDGAATIENSFAATVMGTKSAEMVGGLVGHAEGKLTLNTSYADSYLTGKMTGGLVAQANKALTITSCYAAGYQKATEFAGGFVAKSTVATGINVKNGYTAVTWLDGDEGDGTPKRYSVAPATVENVYFLNGGNDDETDGSGYGTKATYKELSDRTAMLGKLNSDAFVDSAVSSNPYNLRKQGLTSYSYPSLSGMAHYGDWEASFEAGSLVYYEVYADESAENGVSYGFFGANVPSTLSGEKTVLGDGYGIVYTKSEKPNSSFMISYQDGVDAQGQPTEKTLTIDPNGTATSPTVSYEVTVTQGSVATNYIIYPLPADVVNAAAISETFYQKLTINGEAAVGQAATGRVATDGTGTSGGNATDGNGTSGGNATDGTGTGGENTGDGTGSSDVATGTVFYYNPHFAKTAVNANKAPDTPSEIYVRTARQLYDLSQYYADYQQTTAKSRFIQELDIDYASYQWTTYANKNEAVSVQEPIGTKGNTVSPFTATYDGRYHEIRGISFATSGTVVGFIGENAGLVQNVFLVSDYDVSNAVNNPYVKYTGRIGSNKIVYIGVLAGINSGRIRNCAVCGYNMDGDQKIYVQRNGTLYMGGLTGSNRGTIANCQADSPSVNANILYGNAYMGGFAGENASGGIIRDSYALGMLKVEYAKGANAVIGGFTARNAGSLRADYCAVAMTAAGTTNTYGFAPKGGKISSDCYYLNGGTFQYLNQMYAFDNQNGAGKGLTYKELSELSAQTITARCHTATSTDENAGYPFIAVVEKNSAGEAVHYGNWQTPVNLGGMGVLYWELEQGGANDGYHFSFIGYNENSADPYGTLNQTSGSTLCEEHDDGGIVTQYGYGYYYADVTGENATGNATDGAFDIPQVTGTEGFQSGNQNMEASTALSDRLDGFTVVAFTTAPSVGTTAAQTSGYMKMTAQSRQANGVWRFQYKNIPYTFTINPFFANAMQYGSTATNGVAVQSLTILEEDGTQVQDGFEARPMPGEEGNEYEIRSDDQLEYMNWNYNTGDAVTTLDSTNYNTGVVEGYTYLGKMSGTDSEVENYYRWTGTESPELQQYVAVDKTTSRWNGWNTIYTHITREENSSYWEFVENPAGQTYQVPEWSGTWTNHNSRYYEWHTDWAYSLQTKIGYWKWTGTEETPKKADGNNEDANLYIKVDSQVRYHWIQSHDVDADMLPNGDTLFTQIGSLYDEKGGDYTEEANAYMSYFNGSYNGNSYSIKNVEINSRNTVVGLFGSIVGAKVQNIILYSENGNYIQRSADSVRSWYALGGMCGLAAVGKGNSAADTMIINCTVSGYNIQDNSEKGSYGDANVGGMFGMSTLNLEGCTAVNTIILNTQFDAVAGKKDDGVAVRTGGLVGSMRGEVTNCYTGGEIKLTERCKENAKRKGYISWLGGYDSNGSKIYLGGITGGIYIKNKGNLLTLLGNSIRGIENRDKDDTTNSVCSTPTTILKNCYTYIKMPEPGTEEFTCIKTIQPIGANGETPNENDRNFHVRIQVINCYYYKNNILGTKAFTTSDAHADNNAVSNIDQTAVGISWKQLSGQEMIQNTFTGKTDYLLNLLNYDGSGKFSTVTTTENSQTVTGKYSFPGNRTDLDGEDYPFPTILTQKSGNAVVNVHYGEWPLEGIYWKESRGTMDIFADMEMEGEETRGQALKTFELQDKEKVLNADIPFDQFHFTYSNGDEASEDISSGSSDDTQVVQSGFSDGADEVQSENPEEVFSDGDEETGTVGAGTATGTGTGTGTATGGTGTGAGTNTGNDTSSDGEEILDESELIAKVVDMKYDSTSGSYLATVKALKTGTTTIRVTVTGKNNQTYTAAFSVTVTANLTVYTLPESLKQALSDTTDVKVYAVPGASLVNGNAMDSAAEAVFGADMETEGESGFAVGSEGFTNEAQDYAGSDIAASGAETYTGSAEIVNEEEADMGASGFVNEVEAYTGASDFVNEEEAYAGASDFVNEEESYTGTSDFVNEEESYTGTSDFTNEVEAYTESQAPAAEITDFAGAGTYVDMVPETSGSTDAVSAADLQNPEKNFASMMKWTVEAEQEGPLRLGAVDDNGVFSVTSEALGSITVTITGTYTYEGVDYTSTTWLDVTTVSFMGMRWTNGDSTMQLNKNATGSVKGTQTFHLEVSEDALSGMLNAANFAIKPIEGIGATNIRIDSIIRNSDGSYDVTITGTQAGIAEISVSAPSKDGSTTYNASFRLNLVAPATAADGQEDFNTDDMNSADGTVPGSSDDSAFTSDADSGWDDGNSQDNFGGESNDSVDIIPDQGGQADGEISDDESGWES